MGELSGWGKRVKIPLDHDDIDAALSNFPHLIYISESSGYNSKDITFVFDELGSDANRKKIAVTKSDGTTECYVEIVKWDHANEKAWLFVKIPDVNPDVDTELYLYYDSTHADNTDYVGDPSDAVVHNVWDSNFKLVTHMRDDPDTSHIRDSTVNANDGTKLAAGEPTVTTAGIIDDAQDFDGDDDHIVLPRSFDTDVLTVEAVIRRDVINANHMIFGYGSTLIYYGWGFLVGANNFLRFVAVKADGSINFDVPGATTTITAETDFYVTAVCEGAEVGDDAIIYVNAVEEARADQEKSMVWDTILPKLGQWGVTQLQYRFEGIIDEVRFSNIARTPAWIKATKESLWDHLNDFGNEEILGGATYEKTFTADIVLVDREAKTFTGDILLQKTDEKEFAADIVLVDRLSETFTADILLLKSNIETITADIALLKTQAKSITADTVLVDRLTKSITADIVLVDRLSETITADIVLVDRIPETFTADILLQRTDKKEFTADIILVDRLTEQITADTILVDRLTKTITADITLVDREVETFTADVLVQKTGSKDFTADIVLVDRLSKTFTADILLLETSIKTVTADIALVDREIKTFTADTVLQLVPAKTFDTDIVLVDRKSKTFTADIVLVDRLDKTLTADIVVVDRLAKTLTADVTIVDRLVKTFTGDVLLLESGVETITADIVLLKTDTKTVTADIVLQKTDKKEVVADIVLVDRLTKSITADIVLVDRRTETLTSDIVLVDRLTKTFTADVVTSGVETKTKTFTADIIVGEVEKPRGVRLIVREAKISYMIKGDLIIKGEITANIMANTLFKVEKESSITGNVYWLKSLQANILSNLLIRREILKELYSDTSAAYVTLVYKVRANTSISHSMEFLAKVILDIKKIWDIIFDEEE